MTTTRPILSLNKKPNNPNPCVMFPFIIGPKQKERTDKLCDRLTGSIHFSQLRASHA